VDVDAIVIAGPPTPTPTATNTPTATSTATNTPTVTSTTFTTQLTSVNDFNSSVTLALLGLPADATATFATNPLTPTQVLCTLPQAELDHGLVCSSLRISSPDTLLCNVSGLTITKHG